MAGKITTVHPRTHGEHITGVTDALVAFGSSPYTRGTLFLFYPSGTNIVPPDVQNT